MSVGIRDAAAEDRSLSAAIHLTLAPSQICMKPKLVFSSEAGEMCSFNVKKMHACAWAQSIF